MKLRDVDLATPDLTATGVSGAVNAGLLAAEIAGLQRKGYTLEQIAESFTFLADA